MDKMNLDFVMAKYAREDVILRAIAQTALNFLSKYADTNRIKWVLLTGSVANGEGTVVDCNSFMITSDFDFVIYLDFLEFLQNRKYLQNLSQEISKKLMKRGVNTHVTFLPYTRLLSVGACFAKSNIYEYEFALASKSIFGKTPSFRKTARPTKRDALDLTFTVVSDLVFSKFKNLSKIKESYIYAKRSLTLLNSALIFVGAPIETYEKRMKVAKEYASKRIIPLNQNDIKTLEIFTRYKLSGSIQDLLDSLGYKNIEDLVSFQRRFLKELTTKVLYYELITLVGKPTKTDPMDKNSLEKIKNELPNLLREYSRDSKIRLPSRIIGIILYLSGLLINRERKELFATFIFHEQSPKVILNILITLLFIHQCDVSVKKICREVFPWINFNSALVIDKVFSLWQIAEQSIKLS